VKNNPLAVSDRPSDLDKKVGVLVAITSLETVVSKN